MNEEEIMTLTEGMIREMFAKVLEVALPNPFPRMTYAEAMHRFGSDKPDMRIALELVEVADLMKEVEFKVFAAPANDAACRVTALRVPKGGSISRKEIDDYTKYVGIYGARGLAYIKVNELAKGIEGLQSPIIKFLPAEVVMNIMERVGAEDGDIVFFGADKAKVTAAFKIITADPKVKGILVNIFGGIMKCDVIAEGVVAAVKEVGLKVPLVVRLEGTNVALGKKILNESGLAITAADDLDDAAQKIVAAVG